MATPESALIVPKDEVTVSVHVDPDTQEIYIDREPVYIHKSKFEEIKWVCARPANQDHTHGEKCFTIEFTGANKSPFQHAVFIGHGAHTGVAIVDPDVRGKPGKLYKYKITVPDIGELDPQGGVKP